MPRYFTDLFDWCFPKQAAIVDPLAAYTLMALDALVFLPLNQYGDELQDILGADTISLEPRPSQFVPRTMFVRKDNRLIITPSGTIGLQGWWPYVQGFGSKPIGPAPGQVFAPFADAVAALQPIIGRYLQQGDLVKFNGHSLGAAAAAILQSLYTWASAQTTLAWLFALPKYGDPAFINLSRGPVAVLNLPNDPIPYLPPDLYQAIQRTPFEIRWDTLYSQVRGAVALPTWNSVRLAPARLDALCQLAASNVLWPYSPHNTFQYLRALWSLLPNATLPPLLKLKALLGRLGLLDPWPISLQQSQSLTDEPEPIAEASPRAAAIASAVERG